MARVMVVDDSPTDKAFLKQMLERAGHQVIEAGSGQDAIDMARSQKPDCVVMDVVMPGMNGFQATRMLSKDPLTAGIPILVVSSKNQETDRLWALRQGAKEYITKPVKEADLIGKIKAVLGF
jgi:twitching motility two-component system response regulator PilH